MISTVERMRFNEVAQDYNTTFHSFPTNLIAGMFGFKEKAYFQAQAGAETVLFGRAPRGGRG